MLTIKSHIFDVFSPRYEFLGSPDHKDPLIKLGERNQDPLDSFHKDVLSLEPEEHVP